jgi:Tfp pilus assembly protein PilF
MSSKQSRAERRRAAAASRDDKTRGVRPRPPARLPPSAALLLVGLVFAGYANSLPNGFVFDDHTLVDFNPEVNPEVVGAIEHRAIDYRPFRIATYSLDREIGGHHPTAYRVGNLVYHAISGCIALSLYRQLGLGVNAALFAAAVFLIHPVQTESVAYISGRRDVLCGLFVLLAVSLYLRWRSPAGRWWQLAAAGVAVAVGALSKEVAFAFPLLVMAYDLTVSLARERRQQVGRSLWDSVERVFRGQALVYGILGALLLAAGLYFAVNGFPTRQSWWGGTPLTNALNVALLWVHSAVLLLFPVRLLADYSYEAVPLITSAASGLGWSAVVALGALFLLSLWCVGRQPLAVFFLWWAALSLLPSSHVVPHHDFFAEHYLYLPVFGFAGLLSLTLWRVGPRLGLSARRLEALCLLLVALYGVRTLVRNRDWRDGLTLWRVTSTAAPRCARARTNLGGALLTRGDIEGAERELRAALEIAPRQLGAVSAMVMIHHAKGEYRRRDALLRRFQRNRDTSYSNLLSLAGWFLVNREYPLAIELARAAGRRRNTDERALTVEGAAYAAVGEYDKACPLFDRALRLNPGSRDARLGRVQCEQRLEATQP